MQNQPIKIAKLLENPTECLAPSTWGAIDTFYFRDWHCHEKVLRKKAVDLTRKLQHLVDEVLISSDDYVSFDNTLSLGWNTDYIIIMRQQDNEKLILGGLSFSKSKKRGTRADYWGGNSTEGYIKTNNADELFKSWADLKKLLVSNIRLRAEIRDIFITS